MTQISNFISKQTFICFPIVCRYIGFLWTGRDINHFGLSCIGEIPEEDRSSVVPPPTPSFFLLLFHEILLGIFRCYCALQLWHRALLLIVAGSNILWLWAPTISEAWLHFRFRVYKQNLWKVRVKGSFFQLKVINPNHLWGAVSEKF